MRFQIDVIVTLFYGMIQQYHLSHTMNKHDGLNIFVYVKN